MLVLGVGGDLKKPVVAAVSTVHSNVRSALLRVVAVALAETALHRTGHREPNRLRHRTPSAKECVSSGCRPVSTVHEWRPSTSSRVRPKRIASSRIEDLSEGSARTETALFVVVVTLPLVTAFAVPSVNA